MIKFTESVSGSAVALLFFAVMPAATLGADLSKYREFQLGADLPAVIKQSGANPSQVKTLHLRPVLIQQLEWRPQPLGPSSQTDPVKDVVLQFYNGQLFHIAVDYDRYETEGLTTADFVEGVSTIYGVAVKPTVGAKLVDGLYGDQEDIVARWEDPQYRFELIRSSYGPSFQLVGVLKKQEAPAQAAFLEAKRLDDQEAPERNAARVASDAVVANAKLEKARLANKPKFHP